MSYNIFLIFEVNIFFFRKKLLHLAVFAQLFFCAMAWWFCARNCWRNHWWTVWFTMQNHRRTCRWSCRSCIFCAGKHWWSVWSTLHNHRNTWRWSCCMRISNVSWRLSYKESIKNKINIFDWSIQMYLYKIQMSFLPGSTVDSATADLLESKLVMRL